MIATLPPPSTAMASSTKQLDLPGIQVLEPTLEHYVSSEKMTFSPILGYLYKNCKNIVDAFSEGTDPTNLTYDNWTKAAKLVKPDKSESSEKVVCSYPITTMWSNILGTMLICYAIIKYVRPMTSYRATKTVGTVPFTCLYFVTTIIANSRFVL